MLPLGRLLRSLRSSLFGERDAEPPERRYEGVTRRSLADERFVGAAFEPAGDPPYPPVLVLHGSEGTPATGHAALLADRGYYALALQYFGGPDLPSRLLEVPLEYPLRAVNALLAHERTTDAVGVFGASKGAELGLELAVRHDGVESFVGVAPSAYLFESYAGEARTETSCWTTDGEPTPYVPFDRDAHLAAVAQSPPYAYRRLYERSAEVADESTRERARIPVERADADLLLLSGLDDRVWPADRFADTIVARLDEVGFDRRYEHRPYEAAGHALALPHVEVVGNPVSNGLACGGTGPGNRAYRDDAWERIDGHLAASLADPDD